MYVTEFPNPFNPNEKTHLPIEAGNNFGQWFEQQYGDKPDLVGAVFLNGAELPKADYDCTTILRGDRVDIVMLPGDPFTIVAITLSVISLASVAMLPDSPDYSDGEISPTYNLNAQRNQARLGANVPIHYGQVRVWPDLIAQPYTTYIDNDQYLFQLFCIGAGEFAVGNLQIEDTDVTNFDEITYQYYYNVPVTLFPTNVTTSVEPANQVIQYDVNTGPYVANASATQINRIEVDLVWPNGLHRAADEGNIYEWTTSLAIEYREIDDSGNPVASPATFSTIYNGQIVRNSRAPLRITFGADVPAGRYEVQVRRGDTEDTGPRKYSRVTWEGLRGFHEDSAITYTGRNRAG